MLDQLIKDYQIRIDKDGYMLKLFKPIGQLYTKDELLFLRDYIEKTIKRYDVNNINDEKVKEINKQKIDQYWEAMDNRQTKIKKKKQPRKGFIYLAIKKDENCLKIGFTTNIDSRLSQLNTSSEKEILGLYYYSGTIKDEKETHMLFEQYHIKGEWYSFNETIFKHFTDQPTVQYIYPK